MDQLNSLSVKMMKKVEMRLFGGWLLQTRGTLAAGRDQVESATLLTVTSAVRRIVRWI